MAAMSLSVSPVQAGAQLQVCFNYSCADKATVVLSQAHLDDVLGLFLEVDNAEQERQAIRFALSALYSLAGQQTPIWRDRAGNLRDEGADGRMDCIDHANTTTAMLRFLEQHGCLRFHHVLAPVQRGRLFARHWSAAVESLGEGKERQRFVVDTWFVEQGQLALLLPLETWEKGEGGSDW